MSYSLYSSSLIFLAGFCFFSAITQFGVKHPGKKPWVTTLFGVITILLVLSILITVVSYNTTTVPQHLWLVRVYAALNVLVFALLPWFFVGYSNARSRVFPIGSSIFCVMLFIANIVQENTLQYTTVLGMDTLLLPWGEGVSLLKATPSNWGVAASLYILVVPLFALVLLSKRFKAHRTPSTRNMIIAVSVMILGIVQTIVVRILGFHGLPPLGSYGFLGMVIIMGRALTQDLEEDRLRVEKALQESEYKARAILNQGSVFIGLLTPDGILLDANQTSLDLAGVSPQEVLHKPFADSPWWKHSPEQKARLLEGIRLAAQGKDVQFEVTHQAKDGSLHYVDFSLKPVFNDHGQVIYLVPEGHDITERKHTAHLLTCSETRLRSTLENTPNVAIQWFDMEGRVVYWNHASELFYGFSSQEAMGKTLDKLIHSPEEFQKFLKIIQEVHRTGEPYGPYQVAVQMANGSQGYVLATTFAIELEPGIPGFVCMDIDISELKVIEESLRVSENRYRSVIAVSNTGVWEFNNTSKFLWASPEYFQMLGYEPHAFPMDGRANLHEAWINLLHPDDQNQAVAQFVQYLQGGSRGMYQGYYRMRHADDSWVWIWSRGQTLHNSDGSLSNLTVGTHINITEIKRLEEKLEERVKQRTMELVEANDALVASLHSLQVAQTKLVHHEKMIGLTSLVTGIAHELNTPLGNTLTSVTLMKADLGKINAELKAGAISKNGLQSSLDRLLEAGDLAQGGVHKAVALVEAFRKISVIHTIDEPEEVSLDSLFDEVIHFQRINTEQYAVSLEKVLPFVVGVFTYRSLLLQALNHVVENAILHNTGPLRVILSAEATETTVTIRVQDTGKGIPLEIQKRIFEPFFTTRLGKGNIGLGLTICYNLVTGPLGGEVSVDPNQGAGCTVAITLPKMELISIQ